MEKKEKVDIAIGKNMAAMRKSRQFNSKGSLPR